MKFHKWDLGQVEREWILPLSCRGRDAIFRGPCSSTTNQSSYETKKDREENITTNNMHII